MGRFQIIHRILIKFTSCDFAKKSMCAGGTKNKTEGERKGNGLM